MFAMSGVDVTTHSAAQVLHLVLSPSEVSFPINAGRSCCACAAPPVYDVGAWLVLGRGGRSSSRAASLDGRVAEKQKSLKSPK